MFIFRYVYIREDIALSFVHPFYVWWPAKVMGTLPQPIPVSQMNSFVDQLNTAQSPESTGHVNSEEFLCRSIIPVSDKTKKKQRSQYFSGSLFDLHEPLDGKDWAGCFWKWSRAIWLADAISRWTVFLKSYRTFGGTRGVQIYPDPYLASTWFTRAHSEP